MAFLCKKKILITSGPTRGYLDAIRYITNTSTGTLGREIALEAVRRDAVVTYLYGKGSLSPEVDKYAGKSQIKLIEIETIDDLLSVLQGKLKNKKYDAVVHAMAVSDYVPANTNPNKTPSKKNEWTVKLIKTPKVINTIRNLWPEALLVGFKLEVNKPKEELVKIAARFLKKNNADLIVANDYKNISGNRHIAYLVRKDCTTSAPLKNKKEIARGIISHLERMFGKDVINSTSS